MGFRSFPAGIESLCDVTVEIRAFERSSVSGRQLGRKGTHLRRGLSVEEPGSKRSRLQSCIVMGLRFEVKV